MAELYMTVDGRPRLANRVRIDSFDSLQARLYDIYT